MSRLLLIAILFIPSLSHNFSYQDCKPVAKVVYLDHIDDMTYDAPQSAQVCLVQLYEHDYDVSFYQPGYSKAFYPEDNGELVEWHNPAQVELTVSGTDFNRAVVYLSFTNRIYLPLVNGRHAPVCETDEGHLQCREFTP